MKKFLVLFLLISVGLIGVSTMADTVEKERGYISVNASATKEVAPNQAEIAIGIETTDKSLQKASENNKIIANKVYSTLKSSLGADDSIKTSDYSAKPQYIYTKDNKKILDSYLVSNVVTVKTKKLELVSSLIDTAIAQGATNVNNLQFSTVDYDSACSNALAELTKKAHSQASSVAKSINSQLTGIKSINAICNPENNARPIYPMMMKTAVDSVSATPIESGKIKIYANVDASFYVK